jgi:hypothetical protein
MNSPEIKIGQGLRNYTIYLYYNDCETAAQCCAYSRRLHCAGCSHCARPISFSNIIIMYYKTFYYYFKTWRYRDFWNYCCFVYLLNTLFGNNYLYRRIDIGITLNWNPASINIYIYMATRNDQKKSKNNKVANSTHMMIIHKFRCH